MVNCNVKVGVSLNEVYKDIGKYIGRMVKIEQVDEYSEALFYKGMKCRVLGSFKDENVTNNNGVYVDGIFLMFYEDNWKTDDIAKEDIKYCEEFIENTYKETKGLYPILAYNNEDVMIDLNLDTDVYISLLDDK